IAAYLLPHKFHFPSRVSTAPDDVTFVFSSIYLTRFSKYLEFCSSDRVSTRAGPGLKPDDGEMYDEFGNLKKKYRVKTNQADTRPAVAAGRAGWQVEELGVDRDGRERSRDRQRDRGDKHIDHHYAKDRRRSRSRERERGGKERDYDYDHDRNRDRDRDYSRGSRYRN
ncbi:unnamed protein product, partial [Brassica napus]